MEESIGARIALLLLHRNKFLVSPLVGNISTWMNAQLYSIFIGWGGLRAGVHFVLLTGRGIGDWDGGINTSRAESLLLMGKDFGFLTVVVDYGVIEGVPEGTDSEAE